ncbi:MAG: ExbD/TolR family protein [Sphingomonadaceae bacterium]|uniref:ExbD/TolR family protein n=1 Tax=Thermaurantiacus sp. TaxID=2820283 RepID=UPI00298EE297|nr:ExbD/TolR family protein [Thermaurantiacus sp.]MCS6986204.1 ExbD/TolR family protein [Sphingomonadaceae bacterium]MDW8415861.1 ExbD/TolR family protein [Thermaurantiacus sp.]
MAIGLAHGARRRRRRQPMSDINVTPLVDVMLVLLIIFMVAAPLLVTGTSVNLPQTRAKALPTERRPLTITLDRAGRRTIGDEVVAPAAFAARLNALREARGEDTPVFVRADAAVPYGEVARLLADVTAAGFTRVALVHRPEPRARR